MRSEDKCVISGHLNWAPLAGPGILQPKVQNRSSLQTPSQVVLSWKLKITSSVPICLSYLKSQIF